MVDLKRLKQNYMLNPLKKGEYPCKEDLQYLFIECCLSRKECAEICNCTEEKIKIACKKLNIHKTKEQRNQLRKRTLLSTYGKENISQLDEIKQKKEKTCMKNHGVKNGAQSKQGKENSKKTCLNKYGKEFFFQTEAFKKKNEETLLIKYNETNIMRVPQIKEKHKFTIKSRYNCENVQQNEIIHQKSLATRIQNYGDTCLFGTKSFYEKAKETWLKNLGVDNPAKSIEVQKNLDLIRPQIIEKMLNTKRELGNLNKSFQEDASVQLLINKFPSLKPQYKSNEYPYLSDCYIPELDLYIEFNYHWTHENCPFINNTYCMNILKKWQNKAEVSNYYVNAIETWTIRDVIKRKTATDNNLNWLEFFNMKEFMEWYQNLCEILS